jgi:signal transduction histidine kinase
MLEYLAGGGFGADASAEEMMRLAARAGTELRDGLERLGAAHDCDLFEGLHRVIADARTFAEHEIEFAVGPIDATLGRAASGALAASAREALTNVRKHACASRAVVYCEVTGGAALVTVKDNGDGFATLDLEGRMGVRGSLFERMARQGGEARIESEPGVGTLVTLVVGAGGDGEAASPTSALAS